MIDRKLSSRYAKAFLGICTDKGIDEDEVLKKLKELVDFLKDNPKVFEYLSAYVTPYTSKERVISELCSDEILVEFIKYIAKRGRFKLFYEIVETFEELVDEKKGRVKALVKSAIDLDETTKEKLKENLSRKLNKEVLFTFKKDPGLIAGIIVQVKDVVYDGSLKTYLSNLEQKLLRLSI